MAKKGSRRKVWLRGEGRREVREEEIRVRRKRRRKGKGRELRVLGWDGNGSKRDKRRREVGGERRSRGKW